MPKVSKDDLIKRVSEFIKDDEREEGIKLLEDIADTLEDSTDVSSYETRIQELENQVKQVGDEWRARYIERFGTYNADVTPSTNPADEETEVDNGSNDESIDPPTFEDIATEF